MTRYVIGPPTLVHVVSNGLTIHPDTGERPPSPDDSVETGHHKCNGNEFPSPGLTATLSPSDGERERVRGCWN